MLHVQFLRKYCVMRLDSRSSLFIDSPAIIIKQLRKPNTHSNLLFVSCHIEWVKDVRSTGFVLSYKTNYTHMYEFLWSTAAISASDKAEPKSGKHQMPPTLPLYHIKRRCAHRQARAHEQVQQCCTQKAHMLTRKTALCSLYLPTDADDRAADECRLTRD